MKVVRTKGPIELVRVADVLTEEDFRMICSGLTILRSEGNAKHIPSNTDTPTKVTYPTESIERAVIVLISRDTVAVLSAVVVAFSAFRLVRKR